MEKIKVYSKLMASVFGISLAELVASLPSVNEVTGILKLLVQLMLLIIAIFQAGDLWRNRIGKRRER